MARLGRDQPASTRLVRGRPRDMPALFTDLVAFWPMDESSGTRFDVHGAKHLAEVNGVASVAGLLGNAADFVAANSESLDLADPIFDADHDFTYASWVFFPSTPGAYATLAGKGYNGITGWTIFEYGGPLQFRVGGTGLTPASLSWPASGWHLVVARWKHSTKEASLSLDAGTPNVGGTTTPANSGGAFQIGAGSGSHWDDPIDQSYFWNRCLSDAEVTELYNGGTPLTYEEIITGVISADRTETVAATESSTGLADFVGERTETVTASESSTGLADFVSDISEGVTAGESSVGGILFTADLTETVSATESQSATADFAGERTESVTATESQSATADFVGLLTETVTAGDSQTATADFVGARTETVTAGESSTATADFVASITESVTAGDSCDAEVIPGGIPADRTESVTATEEQSATLEAVAAISEALAVADAQSADLLAVGAVAESVAAGDSQSATVVYAASIVETVVATDSVISEPPPTVPPGLSFRVGAVPSFNSPTGKFRFKSTTEPTP